MFFFDRVTNGTYSFVSFISNSNPVGGSFAAVISAKTQFFDQVKTNSTLKLINRIFKALQKLLKRFTGIATSVLVLPTLFALWPSSPTPTLQVFAVILVLYLKDLELEERGFKTV